MLTQYSYMLQSLIAAINKEIMCPDLINQEEEFELQDWSIIQAATSRATTSESNKEPNTDDTSQKFTVEKDSNESKQSIFPFHCIGRILGHRTQSPVFELKTEINLESDPSGTSSTSEQTVIKLIYPTLSLSDVLLRVIQILNCWTHINPRRVHLFLQNKNLELGL